MGKHWTVDLDSKETALYVMSIDLDTSLIATLSEACNEDHLVHLLEKHGLIYQRPSISDDLRKLFKSSRVSFALLCYRLRPGKSGSVRTPFAHAVRPGVTPSPAKDDGNSVVAASSFHDEKSATGAHPLERGFTRSFEILSSQAVTSLLPTVFGIEFSLRNANDPSRHLDDNEVLEYISSASGKNVSKEIDVFGYVDYFNNGRIEYGGHGEERIACIGQTNLEVSSPQIRHFSLQHILIW